MKRIIITLCICTAWVASTYAQYPYTLKKCLEEGLANNYSIRITRNEEQISHNNATLANAGYLPTVDLSAGYTGTLDNTDTKSWLNTMYWAQWHISPCWKVSVCLQPENWKCY